MPKYVTLGPDDLSKLSELMLNLLRTAGVKKGDRILIYDFNTALSTLVMSRTLTPGLGSGVSERLGCSVMCTDGLSELAARSAYVYSVWNPDILLIRSDLVSPFHSRLKSGLESNKSLRCVFVVHSGAAAWPRRVSLGSGAFDRFLLYRVDPALFMCLVRPCGGLHYASRFHELECVSGTSSLENGESSCSELSVRPNFSRYGSLQFHSSLECHTNSICACGDTHALRTEPVEL